MAIWKRWMVCGALLGSAVACGNDENADAEDGGTFPAQDASSSDAAQGQGDAGQATSDAGQQDGAASGDSGMNTLDAGMSSADCDGLKATIRDFKPETHPDFQKFQNTVITPGIVKDTLGDDHKPQFNAANGQVTSAESFASWYNDVAGVNQAIEIPPLMLTPMTGGFEFDDSSFFPIDNMGFGNYANGHNFHFTTEIHTSFTYKGGERFEFRGDDDLWIFVNDKLALDLGGLHPAVQGMIDFDAQAEKLGITKGNTYRMDIFHAERRTNESNFRITTNIECFKDPVLQ